MINQILESIEKLTLLETAELVKKMEEKFGVSSQVPTQIIQQPIKEEPTEVSVILKEVPVDKKIAVLKEIRTITGLGLKEAKDFVDSIPKPIKTLKKEDAEKLKTQLEQVGAIIELK